MRTAWWPARVAGTAAPASGLEVAARATFSRSRNLYFYRNDPLQPSRFDLVYDSAGITVANIHADLLYNVYLGLLIGWAAGIYDTEHLTSQAASSIERLNTAFGVTQ